MHYLAYFSSYFPKSSMEELSSMFERIRPIASSVNVLVFEAEDRDIGPETSGRNLIFIYRLLKLPHHGRIDEARYLASVADSISALELPKKRLKIECFNVNSRRGYSAKDIEVSLGLGLERQGYAPDLTNPEILAYAVIINMEWYSGYLKFGDVRFIDPYRHYKVMSSGISRAELKLKQALDEFGIKADTGIAIDLGAAPGGWTYLLAKHGMKVLAIDKGRLDYDRFDKLGVSVLVLEDRAPTKEDLNSFRVIHIMSGFEDAKLPNCPISLITDDMNISPTETSAAVLLFSKHLKKGSPAIITIKCTTRYIRKHLRNASEALKNEFEIKSIKVLPNNRQEATFFAVKR